MALKDRLAKVPVLGTALQVQERYKRDAADQLAAAIGFFGFLSLFPLMALAVAVAGFVFSDPDQQAEVALLITQAIPGFEATLGEGETGVAELVSNVVDNRGTIGLVGVVTLLFTGLRVVNSAMTTSTVVFRAQVPTGVKAKVRQVVVLVALGVLALAAVTASSLAGAPEDLLPRGAAVALALSVTFVLDVGLFLAAYRLLRGDAPVTVRDLLPGAVLAGVGWTALKVAGASYVGNQVDDANAMYGALGGVIALMLLLYLAGRLYLYGAQLSAVLLEKRAGPLDDLETVEEVEAAIVAHDDPAFSEPTGDGQGPRAPGDPVDHDPAARRVAAAGAGVPAPATGSAAADPGPRRLPPAIGSPAVSDTTRARLDAAGAVPVRPPAGDPSRGRGADARAAAGFALGAAALAAAWRLLRDDDA